MFKKMVVVHAFNSRKYRQVVFEFEVSLFYRASSRIVSETRATISQEPKENKRQKRIFG